MNKHFIISMITLFLVLLGGNETLAQTQRLVVWQKDGEKVVFDLSERPKTVFEGTDIVISTSTMIVSYPIDRVLRYTYELKPSGIENTNISKSIIISQNGDELLLENLHQGTCIQVFSTDGKLISTQIADGRKTTIISLATSPSGVYVVKANDVTYKLMKR